MRFVERLHGVKKFAGPPAMKSPTKLDVFRLKGTMCMRFAWNLGPFSVNMSDSKMFRGKDVSGRVVQSPECRLELTLF